MRPVSARQAAVIRQRVAAWHMSRVEAAYLSTLAGRRVQGVDDLTSTEASHIIGLPHQVWGDAVVHTLERHALEAS